MTSKLVQKDQFSMVEKAQDQKGIVSIFRKKGLVCKIRKDRLECVTIYDQKDAFRIVPEKIDQNELQNMFRKSLDRSNKKCMKIS